MQSQDKEYQLVVIGGGAVGKSALTVQFIQGLFVDEYDPTIEDSYHKKVTVNNQDVILDILDTAGQEEYSAMRDQYVRSGQGFLLVFSLTSHESFEEVQPLYNQIMRAKNNDPNFPIVLIGNKSDLEQERVVSYDECRRLANRLNMPYVEASAKTRTNVDESFTQLAELMLKYDNQQSLKARTRSQSRTDLTHPNAAAAPEPKESTGCCRIA